MCITLCDFLYKLSIKKPPQGGFLINVDIPLIYVITYHLTKVGKKVVYCT